MLLGREGMLLCLLNCVSDVPQLARGIGLDSVYFGLEGRREFHALNALWYLSVLLWHFPSIPRFPLLVYIRIVLEVSNLAIIILFLLTGLKSMVMVPIEIETTNQGNAMAYLSIWKLRHEAISSLRFRGHVIPILDDWIELYGSCDRRMVFQYSCSRCGRSVTIDNHPTANGIDIGGAAVALTCA